MAVQDRAMVFKGTDTVLIDGMVLCCYFTSAGLVRNEGVQKGCYIKERVNIWKSTNTSKLWSHISMQRREINTKLNIHRISTYGRGDMATWIQKQGETLVDSCNKHKLQ